MIGVFDSGVGGLSALAPLRRMMPSADILYLADTAALPLGEKSDAEISSRISRALSCFRAESVSAVLLACGTASSLITEECKERFPFPIFDIISPTASTARSLPPSATVVLLSTEAAARAGVFASALSRRALPVFTLACPAFVRMAESGKHPSRKALCRILSPILPLAPSGVILGCTHFSLLEKEIAAALPHARIFDAAALGAVALAAHLYGTKEETGCGTTRFFVTGDPRRFERSAARVLKHPVRATPITLPS